MIADPGGGRSGRVVDAELTEWYAHAPGNLVIGNELELLERALPNLFGYHIVQCGRRGGVDLLESSRISHRICLDQVATTDVDLVCTEDSLPLAGNAVDVLVLPHVLEFAGDRRKVLREAERVLIGEGHIVILGFNPWSWFGITRLVRGWLGHAPWNGRFISAARLQDWLQLLGFDIIRLSRAGYRPPLRHAGINRRLAFVEKLGAVCWPLFGNVYLLVGRKRVEGITPLRTSWRQRRNLVAGSVAEPTARRPLGRRRVP